MKEIKPKDLFNEFKNKSINDFIIEHKNKQSDEDKLKKDLLCKKYVHRKISDIEFILDKLEKILDKQETDFQNYVDTYFTKEEANRHIDNMYYFLAKKESTLAILRMELLSDGRSELKSMENTGYRFAELEKQEIIQDLVDQEEIDIERFANFAKTLINKDHEKDSN